MAADPMAADPMGVRPTSGFEGWNLREEPPGPGFGGPDDPWQMDDDDGEHENDGRKRLLLTVGAAVLVALLGAGAVMYLTSGGGEGEQSAQAAVPADDEPVADPEPTSSDSPKKKNQPRKNQKPRLGGVSLSQKCIDEYNMGAEPLVIAKFKGQGKVVYEWFQNGHGLEKEKIQVSGTATVKQLMPGTSQAMIKVTSPRPVTKTLAVSAC